MLIDFVRQKKKNSWEAFIVVFNCTTVKWNHLHWAILLSSLYSIFIAKFPSQKNTIAFLFAQQESYHILISCPIRDQNVKCTIIHVSKQTHFF